MEKMCMFLCFYVNFKHENTCKNMHVSMIVQFPFSACFYPHYIIMVKGYQADSILLWVSGGSKYETKFEDTQFQMYCYVTVN